MGLICPSGETRSITAPLLTQNNASLADRILLGITRAADESPRGKVLIIAIGSGFAAEICAVAHVCCLCHCQVFLTSATQYSVFEPTWRQNPYGAKVITFDDAGTKDFAYVHIADEYDTSLIYKAKQNHKISSSITKILYKQKENNRPLGGIGNIPALLLPDLRLLDHVRERTGNPLRFPPGETDQSVVVINDGENKIIMGRRYIDLHEYLYKVVGFLCNDVEGVLRIIKNEIAPERPEERASSPDPTATSSSALSPGSEASSSTQCHQIQQEL